MFNMIPKRVKISIDDSPELSSSAAKSLTFEEMDVQWDELKRCFVIGVKRK